MAERCLARNDGFLCLLAEVLEPLLALGREAGALAALLAVLLGSRLGVILNGALLLGLSNLLSVDLSDVGSASAADMRRALAGTPSNTVNPY